MSQQMVLKNWFDEASLAVMSQRNLMHLAGKITARSPEEPGNLQKRASIYRHLKLPEALVEHVDELKHKMLEAFEAHRDYYLDRYTYWDYRNNRERLAVARYHVDVLCDALSISTKPNTRNTIRKNADALAFFDHEDGEFSGQVYLNKNSDMYRLRFFNFLDCVSHEVGHAYSLQRMQELLEADKRCYSDLQKAWNVLSYDREAVRPTSHYFQPEESVENYWNQPEERWARHFAAHAGSCLSNAMQNPDAVEVDLGDIFKFYAKFFSRLCRRFPIYGLTA